MTITLRPYQEKSVIAIQEDWNSGLNDVLLTMATGGGKTAVFCALLNQVLQDGKRAMIIAHRKELIDQPIDRLYSYFPAWVGRAGVVMGKEHQPDRQIVVGTVQSLMTRERKTETEDLPLLDLLTAPKVGKVNWRLKDILDHGPIDYLIIDECHHVTDKNGYKSVYDVLRGANPAMKHLGVTATPIRADGDGLSGVYQHEAAHYGIVELMKLGYLAPVRWLAIQTAISVAEVDKRQGDFAPGQLADVFETQNCFDLVVESHKKFADGRQAIAFTVSVDGAYKLAESFNAAGIKAIAADGNTDKEIRKNISSDFSKGVYQVVVNVGLYTEGVDYPWVSCIHNVRPTQSDGLYTQMIGRALRLYPGKADALILDYCPAETRNISMMGDILGTPLRKKSLLNETKEAGETMGGFTFDGKFNYEGSAADIVGRELDYLDISPWSWYRDESGFLSLGLGKASDETERTLLITPPDTNGNQTLYGIAKKADGYWKPYQIATGPEFETLSERGEELANKWGNAVLAKKAKKWRNEPPSAEQIKFGRRLGIYHPGMSKGTLAQAITHTLAIRNIRP